VTRFDVDDAYANRFERHIVGAREHEELWVAAEELSTFNAHILSPISVVSAFFGPSFDGCPAEPSARSLLHGLALAQRAGEPDLARELRAAELATFLYFPYWACPGMELGLDPESLQATLESVRRCWPRVMSAAPLLGRAETVSR
jgi:hypothetical protein